MPMKMGIHCKPGGCGHSGFLDSRLRGNDGDMAFPRKRLNVESSALCPLPSALCLLPPTSPQT